MLKSFVYVELFFESLFTGKVSQRVVRETRRTRGPPAGTRESDRREERQRTAAKPNSPAERDELRKVTQRSSARRRAVSLLTSAGGVMPKDPPQRPKKPGVKYDLTTCACLLSCSDFQQRGFYVASWTATTGSDDAALRDG